MEVRGPPCNAVGGTAPSPACLSLACICLQASPPLCIMPLPGKERGASKALRGWMEPPLQWGNLHNCTATAEGNAETCAAHEGDTHPLYPWPSLLTWDSTSVEGCPGRVWHLQCWAIREGTRNNHGAFHPALEQGQGLYNLPRSPPATLSYPFSPFESSGSEGKQCLLTSDLPGRCDRVRSQNFLTLSPVP